MSTSPIKIWRNHKQVHQALGRIGKIVVWTRIFVAPLGFEKEAPYVVAIVEFAGGERLPLQVVDLDHELVEGEKVITCVRKIGSVKPDEVIEYGIKVKQI